MAACHHAVSVRHVARFAIHASDQLLLTTAHSYLSELNDHIRIGDVKPRCRFISATTDLEQAMWWSYGGIQKIVRIDMKKVSCLQSSLLHCSNILQKAIHSVRLAR
jgi:hypothetical protein